MIYCDSSYLVRLYVDERGSGEVRELCSDNSVASSIHALVEVPSALHRAFREQRLDATAFAAVMAQFEIDRAHDAFR